MRLILLMVQQKQFSSSLILSALLKIKSKYKFVSNQRILQIKNCNIYFFEIDTLDKNILVNSQRAKARVFRLFYILAIKQFYNKMYKGRITNGFPEKNMHNNPVSLHSLLKSYLESASIPKSHKQIFRNQGNIENEDNYDESQFNGLIKGLRLKASRNEMIRKNSLDAMQAQELQQKKNAEKSIRPRSKKTFIVKNKVSVKSKITQNKIIKLFFRNQILSLYQILNRKDDYYNLLKGKKTEIVMPMKSNEVQEIFSKLLEAKGKDRGRVKFNHLTNQQLRSLKYKPKPLPTINLSKKAKIKNGDYVDVDSGQEEQQEQNKQENIDMNTWKKRNGCGYNQKVYIVKGGYFQLRKLLTQRGWFQNQDVYSKFYDMKWTTQTCDIDYGSIRAGQVVNHFNNNHHLTSKYGLTRRLKTLIIHYGIDIDKFYPRCFDLGDQTDFENFVENFKFSFAESVAKRFLVDKDRYKGLQLKIRYIFQIIKRRLVSMTQLVNCINNGIYTLITPEQWQIITQTTQWDEGMKKDRLQKVRQADDFQVREDENYQAVAFDLFDKELRVILDKMNMLDPQLGINGFRNVWIAKPNFLSRGRGIRCFNNLYDIADYCLGKDVQFVIQKYIENPLLINSRKFDIRQWVLIEDFNPPTIWFYEECYLRFCCDDYSLDNIHNRFMHLTNNSIQKYNKNAVIQQSMWEMRTFIEYIGAQKWQIIQDKMKSIIVWSIKSCEGSVTGKKGFFEMVGYDFMIDQNLNPWLIEINMSPSMDYSTPVTKKLVKMVQRDVGNIITSTGKKKQKNSGLFTCIYRSEQDLPKYMHFNS